MKIKDLYSGRIHEYGSNSHDSLVISDDGRSLTYYNLQNGDGSDWGDYRFVPYMEADANYWNIGGVKTKRKTGKWINTAPKGKSDNIVCNQCGYDSIADYKFCPNCGVKMEGTECS